MNVTGNIATSFTADQHLKARATCLNQYTAAMGITFAVSVAHVFLILAYGPAAPTFARLALAASIVAITAYGALAGKASLEEAKAIIDDHVEAMPGTRYGKSIAGLPIGLFTALTVSLVTLIGVLQLVALFAA